MRLSRLVCRFVASRVWNQPPRHERVNTGPTRHSGGERSRQPLGGKAGLFSAPCARDLSFRECERTSSFYIQNPQVHRRVDNGVVSDQKKKKIWNCTRMRWLAGPRDPARAVCVLALGSWATPSFSVEDLAVLRRAAWHCCCCCCCVSVAAYLGQRPPVGLLRQPAAGGKCCVSAAPGRCVCTLARPLSPSAG